MTDIKKVNCENIEISNKNRICIIAGPCQLETEQHAMDMAGKIKEITSKFNLGFIYKTSFFTIRVFINSYSLFHIISYN